MSNIFDQYAEFYDLLYADKNYHDESIYIQKLLEKYSTIDCKSILELGSGTGKHACLLAEEGLSITGVEISCSMIEKARVAIPNKLEGLLKFIQGDATSYRDLNLYDACLSLFHVVSYQTSDILLSKILTTAAVHLKDGGIFIFDFWYGPAVLWQHPETRVKRWADKDISIVRVAKPKLHDEENIVQVNYSLYFEDCKSIISKVDEVHRMRYFFILELQKALANAGFALIATEEWLTGHPPSVNTWGVCAVAQKL